SSRNSHTSFHRILPSASRARRPATTPRHAAREGRPMSGEVPRLVPQYGRVNTTQFEKVRSGRGFFAALDQSGGSTPGALAEYGISKDRYSSDAEMFDLVHAMRTRVITNPAFDGSRVLWDEKNVVPFLKVDLGLAPEQDSVQLMKPIDTLDSLIERAQQHQIFG